MVSKRFKTAKVRHISSIILVQPYHVVNRELPPWQACGLLSFSNESNESNNPVGTRLAKIGSSG
jgi:hypothetical protein